MKIYLNDIGGLGNRMLEYAFLRSLIEFYSCEYAIFPDNRKDFKNDELYRMIKDDSFFADRVSNSISFIKNKELIQKIIFYIRKHTSRKAYSIYDLEKELQSMLNRIGIISVTDGYVPIEINETDKTYLCNGYFQSEKYWEDISDEIKELYYHPELITDNNSKLLQTIKNTNSVCIHIRLGDYVENEVTRKRHYVCTPDYYKDAIEQAKKDLKDPIFVVFTNDVNKAKEILSDYPELIYCEERNAGVVDMQMMIQCKHFIISNSTFSWWAQYLCRNSDKIVYAPDRWFNDGTVTDLYDDKWKIIEVKK